VLWSTAIRFGNRPVLYASVVSSPTSGFTVKEIESGAVLFRVNGAPSLGSANLTLQFVLNSDSGTLRICIGERKSRQLMPLECVSRLLLVLQSWKPRNGSPADLVMMDGTSWAISVRSPEYEFTDVLELLDPANGMTALVTVALDTAKELLRDVPLVALELYRWRARNLG